MSDPHPDLEREAREINELLERIPNPRDLAEVIVKNRQLIADAEQRNEELEEALSGFYRLHNYTARPYYSANGYEEARNVTCDCKVCRCARAALDRSKS